MIFTKSTSTQQMTSGILGQALMVLKSGFLQTEHITMGLLERYGDLELTFLVLSTTLVNSENSEMKTYQKLEAQDPPAETLI